MKVLKTTATFVLSFMSFQGIAEKIPASMGSKLVSPVDRTSLATVQAQPW